MTDPAPLQLVHAQIAARIPHAGRMCVLEGVTFWDMRRIVCIGTNHRDPDHPLRTHTGLGIAAGIEYAAQAMAVHGSLLAQSGVSANQKPPPGFLASVRSVDMHLRRLDVLACPLRIEATQLAGDAQALVYAFELHGTEAEAGQLLLSGRASVMLLGDLD